MKFIRPIALSVCALLFLAWLLVAPVTNHSHDDDQQTISSSSNGAHGVGDHSSKHTTGEWPHDSAHQHIDPRRLQSLLDRHISTEMRETINEALMPNGQPPKSHRVNGHWVLDTSDRAGSVMIAMIDEDDGLVVTDIMQPMVITDATSTADRPQVQPQPNH